MKFTCSPDGLGRRIVSFIVRPPFRTHHRQDDMHGRPTPTPRANRGSLLTENRATFFPTQPHKFSLRSRRDRREKG